MGIAERRQRERQERIERIFSAAIKVFSEKGYSDANMNEIAEAAELGKATLYYYFPCKEELFYSLLREETRNFYSRAYQQVKNIKDVCHFAEALIRFHLDYFRERPELLKLFFPVGRSSPVFIKGNREFEQEIASYRKPLEEKLRELLDRKEVPLSAQQFMDLLWTFLLGSSMKLVQGYTFEKVEEGVQLFLQLLKKFTGGCEDEKGN